MGLKNILMVLITLTLVGTACYIAGNRASDTHWQARWSERDAADASARAEQESRNREAEHTMQHAISKVTQNAEQKLNSARTDADSADAAAERLRGTVTELQRRLRESQSTVDSALAGKREAEARAGILLAELLKDSDKRAGEYAAAADDARIRGVACEQAYDAVTRALQ